MISLDSTSYQVLSDARFNMDIVCHPISSVTFSKQLLNYNDFSVKKDGGAFFEKICMSEIIESQSDDVILPIYEKSENKIYYFYALRYRPISEKQKSRV